MIDNTCVRLPIPLAKMNRINLLIAVNRNTQDPNDFRHIARLIRERAPDISAHVALYSRFLPPAFLWYAMRPTLMIEINRNRGLRPFRGHVITQDDNSKIKSYELLEKAGIPVPRWCVIDQETRLDPEEWGPYVLTKPDKGFRGAYVRISRTGRVRHVAAEKLPKDHPGRHGKILAQKFIYTGRWPVSYRVATCLGRVLYSTRYTGRRDKPPLEPDATSFNDANNKLIPVLATARGCSVEMNTEKDILELGRRVHAAYGDIPVLGIDIIREQPSGNLYVCEVNPEGWCWLLSTPGGKQMQAEFGLDFYNQFSPGALEVSAEAMIEAARRLAR